MYGDLGRDRIFGVKVVDGEGTEHSLSVTVNEGNADANTGIFGWVSSREGLWCSFNGAGAGDCGTLVQSTELARARHAPHKTLDPIPEELLWSENLWSFQVEALCFAWAMACMKCPAYKCGVVPPNLSSSFMKVLGKHIDKRIPPDVWAIIGKKAEVRFFEASRVCFQ